MLAKRMAGMDGGPGGDPGALGWFAATWALMTIAMMMPAAAPAVLRVVSARPARVSLAALLFLVGYGAVWMLAGLGGWTLVRGVRAVHSGALAWSAAGRYLAGAAVAAASVYQLTAAKRRWLARCAEPELPLPSERLVRSLRAGVAHGRCCVACCWTLMASLYALGAMSLVWMALLTALIAGERLLARRSVAVRAVAAVMVVLGLAVAASPAAVPALTVPSGAPMSMAQRADDHTA